MGAGGKYAVGSELLRRSSFVPAWIPIAGIGVYAAVFCLLITRSEFSFSNAYILLGLVAVFALIAAAFNASQAGFAHPVVFFSIGFLQYYLLGPLTQVLFGNALELATPLFGHLNPSDDGLLARSLLLSILGLACFTIGYLSDAWRVASTWHFERIGVYWNYRRAVMVACAAAAVFVAGMLIFFGAVGFSAYMGTPRTLRHFLYEKAVTAGFLIDFSETTVVLLSVAVLERFRDQRLKALLIVASLLLPYAVFHQEIFSGSRIQLVRVIVILAVYWHLRVRSLGIGKLAIYGVILLAVITLLGFFRSGLGDVDFDAATKSVNVVASWSGILTVLVYAMDFPTTYDIFLMITNHRPDFDFGYGITYAKLVLSVIPRDLWPDKPENITWVATQIFRPEMLDLGVSYNPSILGEMYYNFGFLGIMVGAFGLGVACRWLHHYWRSNQTRPGAVLIYSTLLFSILEQFRGAFSNITIHYIVFYVVPVIVISLLARPPGKFRAAAIRAL